jgi:hypothetical protein
MSKEKRIRAILDRWRKSGNLAPKEEVRQVLDFYFHGRWHDNAHTGQTGSHEFKITDGRLKGFPLVGADGDFVIPVTHGKSVKSPYLKKLLKTIKQLPDD